MVPLTPITNGAPVRRLCRARRYSLPGEPMATNRTSGSGADRGRDLGLFCLAVVPVAMADVRGIRDTRARHVRPRAEYFRPCSEYVRPRSLHRGESQQAVHQVDAGHAGRQRVPKKPRGPHHRLAIGRDELAPFDSSTKLGVLRIATSLATLMAMCCANPRDRITLFAERERSGQIDAVDVAAQHLRAPGGDPGRQPCGDSQSVVLALTLSTRVTAPSQSSSSTWPFRPAT